MSGTQTEALKIGKTDAIKQIWRNIRRTLLLAWRADRLAFVSGILFSIVLAAFPIATGYIFKLFLDQIVVAQSTLHVVGAALLGVFALQFITDLGSKLFSTFLYEYLWKSFGHKFESFLTHHFLEGLVALDVPHFENLKTQNTITKAIRGYTWRIPRFVDQTTYLVHSVATFVGSGIVLASFGWWIPFLVLLSIIPGLFLRNKYARVAWSLFEGNTEDAKELGYITDALEDLPSVKEIKIAQAGRGLLERIRGLQEKLFQDSIKPLQGYVRSVYAPSILESIVTVFLVYLQLQPTVQGILTIGSFSFFLQMISRTFSSSRQVVNELSQLYEHNLYVNYYFDVLNLPKIIKEKTPGHEFDTLVPPKLEFENVDFAYEEGKPVLKDISFTLEPGQHLAIVGHNGAGKSTLVQLLLRFYDPTQGSILVNGYDLRDLRLSNWYKFVSILFQDFVKFYLTVKDNITFGNTEHVNLDRVYSAAKKSGADAFIQELPKKYDQRLGRRFEDGVELSQGQWQKLALARVFYESAPILILDEPTSAIDAEAEAAIFDNLYETYQDRTLVLVSHRFSTVRNADKIIVLDHGKIVETGDHNSLIKENGLYARMFRTQAKGYVE